MNQNRVYSPPVQATRTRNQLRNFPGNRTKKLLKGLSSSSHNFSSMSKIPSEAHNLRRSRSVGEDFDSQIDFPLKPGKAKTFKDEELNQLTQLSRVQTIYRPIGRFQRARMNTNQPQGQPGESSSEETKKYSFSIFYCCKLKECSVEEFLTYYLGYQTCHDIIAILFCFFVLLASQKLVELFEDRKGGYVNPNGKNSTKEDSSGVREISELIDYLRGLFFIFLVIHSVSLILSFVNKERIEMGSKEEKKSGCYKLSAVAGVISCGVLSLVVFVTGLILFLASIGTEDFKSLYKDNSGDNKENYVSLSDQLMVFLTSCGFFLSFVFSSSMAYSGVIAFMVSMRLKLR